jgi:hypothetical protein
MPLVCATASSPIAPRVISDGNRSTRKRRGSLGSAGGGSLGSAGGIDHRAAGGDVLVQAPLAS